MRFKGMETYLSEKKEENRNTYKEVAEALSLTATLEKEYEDTLKQIERIKEKGVSDMKKTEEKIILREFLLKKTKVKELCVIRYNGWITTTCWIDYEDLFAREMKGDLLDKIVEKDEWDFLPIVNENNAEIQIPCHYIDVIDKP